MFLLSGQFACGDIVTYLTQIVMESTVVDAVQTAELNFTFLADSTGQSGAAHSEIVGVSINYGQVENGNGGGSAPNPGEGFFGLDGGIVDDGGSTATLQDTYLTGPLFGIAIGSNNEKSEVFASVLVDDLEAGEKVVLRIDVRLACKPGSSPTGNLQGALVGKTAKVVGKADTAISGGEQTIPFLKVGELAGAGAPTIRILKTVTTATGTCGVDDVDVLTVNSGDTVKYCYIISNDGTADLYDVTIRDDNGTPIITTDDFFINPVSSMILVYG
jgi:hypothetical protein